MSPIAEPGYRPGRFLQTIPRYAMTFNVTSTSFAEGDHLADLHVVSEEIGFGCAGGNVSPALAWSGAPQGTQSFAVTCYDPDAPTGSGFWHWILLNLPPDTTELPAGAGTDASLRPGGFSVVNDYGTIGYGGPCPPPGDPHRYIFTIHALGVDALPVTAETPQAVARFQLHAAAIASATLTGLYQR